VEITVIKAFVDDPADLPTSDTVPWTIRNKYYSADVHFHLIEYARWDPQSALRVPAVIFVWARGQVISFGLSISVRLLSPLALPASPPPHTVAHRFILSRMQNTSSRCTTAYLASSLKWP
jgi:hypothetical protein